MQEQTQIIPVEKSVIPACDVSLDVFEEILQKTGNILRIGGYKIGPVLTGRLGYDEIVRIKRGYTDKPLIYDGQKLGTDIPDTAEKILSPIKEAGIDAVILFPQSGPVTQIRWTEVAQKLELGVLIGGEMTHPGYRRDEGGYFTDEDFIRIYLMGVAQGVRNFVVPGNKIDRVGVYRKMIESATKDPVDYWSPGLVAQGGNISDGAKAAGDRWHAIVGRGIYKAEDKRAAALELTSQLD